MPLQNRATPLGEIVAESGRGLVFGNRGCLHDDEGTIRRRFNGRRWIACRLEFRGRRRLLLQPRRYTELFFLDEATAFAAGHRPCAECRHEDYVRFVALWPAAGEPGTRPGADAIDAQLHRERVDPATRGQRRAEASLDELPEGAFVLHDDAPHVVVGGHLHRWTPAGYATRIPRPAGRATLLTPPSLVAILSAGWQPDVPLLHPSATG